MHERVYDVCMMYVCVCGKAKMAGMDRMYPRYGWMDVCVCMYVCMFVGGVYLGECGCMFVGGLR